MSKQSPLTEWQVVENDAEWECLTTPSLLDNLPEVAPTAHSRRDVKRYLGWVAALLLVLASAGVWGGRVTVPGWQPATANPTATMQQPRKAGTPYFDPLAGRATDDPLGADGWPEDAGVEHSWRPALQTIEPTSPSDAALYTVDVQGDQDVIRIVRYTGDGTPVYPQTRFYRRTASGWQLTAPHAILWGPEDSLETTFFVLHFSQNDAPAVLALAPQLDALYTTLRNNFGLALTPAEKLVIEVSVTQPPGQDPSWLHAPDRLIVPSPAVYWAPAELSDTDLLAQALALPLLVQVLVQADEQYHIGPTWQPLMDGLYLWQVWELDLPLAVWREEIVQWLYVDLPATPAATVVLPKRYLALCDAHKLWISSPVQIGIPLLCLEWYWERLFFASWRPRDPFTRLDQLTVRADQSDPHDLHYPRGQSVALATLIEYTVAAYGRERLPALMAGLGQYQSWETLLPAVYSVSVADFEAGWQSYLADRYGVPSVPLE